MKKSVFIGCVFAAIILGISLGILVHVYNDEKVAKAQYNQIKEINTIKENRTVVKTSTDETKISPNAIITFEIYYNKCGHSAIKKEKIEGEDVNKNKEELSKKYFGWQIKKFTSDEIELYKEENTICNKHYIIREKEGYIYVYTIDGEGNETLKEKTEISTQYLPEGDKQLLKNGIKANGDTDLQEKISDFE